MAFIKSLALNGILIAIIAHGLLPSRSCGTRFFCGMKNLASYVVWLGAISIFFTIGTFAGAMALLLIPTWRRQIFEHSEQAPPRSKAGYMLNRFLAGVGSSLVVFAVSRTSLSMVEAISGTRYVIIFLAAFAIIKSRPSWFREDFTRRALLIKVLRTALVVVGLILAGLHGGNTGAGGPSWNLIFLVALTGCVAGSINRPERSNLSKHVFP